MRSPGARSPAGAGKATEPGAAQGREQPAADYERLRSQVLAAQPGGWRHGRALLARQGMAAWIAARPAAGGPAGPHGTAAADPRPLPLSVTPGKGGEPGPARGLLPPAATADIVAVLAAMTLARASS